MAEPAQKGNPLEQLVPLLMLASPLLELAKPGVGVGMYQGVMQHQQRTQERDQALVFSLAKDLGNVDEENLPMVKEALKAQGLAPQKIDAAISLSRMYRIPGAKALREFEHTLTEEDIEGLGRVKGTPAELQRLRIQRTQAEETRRLAANDPLRRLQIKREIAQVSPQDVGEELAALGTPTGPSPAPGQGIAGTAIGERIIRPAPDPQRALQLRRIQTALAPAITMDETFKRVNPHAHARAIALWRQALNPNADPEALAVQAEEVIQLAVAARAQATKIPSTAKERVLQKIERGEKLTPGEQEIKRQEIDRREPQGTAETPLGGEGRWRLIRRGKTQKVVDVQTGIELSVPEAAANARREGDETLAKVLGIKLKPKGGLPEGSIPATLAEAVPLRTRIQSQLLTANDPAEYARLSKWILALDEAIEKMQRRGRVPVRVGPAGPVTPVPPASVGAGNADPLGLRRR